MAGIGGLADTVFDRDYSARHPGDRNGYVFHQPDNPALQSAMARAIGLWYSYPAEFRHLMLNGIRQDHSWAWPGQHYLNIYDHIRHKEDPRAPGKGAGAMGVRASAWPRVIPAGPGN